MLDFRPPLDSPALIASMKLVAPLYLKIVLHDTELKVAEGALERFRQVQGQRALLCPNHSNRHDPQTMFFFSKIVDEDFNFVAAREVFDWDNGKNGWWLQHMGTYSVVRGAPDRESFKMTKKILVEGKKRLVLFPEGEISRQNDTLMPLETGAAQLSFWALEELNQSDAQADIRIVPMALKYTYRGDVRPALSKTLSEIEDKLDINADKSKSLYLRLFRVAEHLLKTLEKEYGLKPAEGAPFIERIQILRRSVLQRMAGYFGIDISDNEKLLDSVRVLRNKIDDFVYEDDENYSEYQREVHEEKAQLLKGFYKDLNRVVNFVAVSDTYVKENMTQERFADVLERIETEVLGGEPAIKGPRTVLIDVGDPISLRDVYADYKANKKVCLAKITENMFSQMSDMLQKLDKTRTPVLIE